MPSPTISLGPSSFLDSEFAQTCSFYSDFHRHHQRLDDWLLLSKRYAEFLGNKRSEDAITTTPIPKIVHHIWLGGSMPRELRSIRDLWFKLNPGYFFQTWNELSLRELGLYDIPLVQKFDLDYGTLTDIARLLVLWKHGGAYVDTDLYPVKPLDRLFGDFPDCSFIAGQAYSYIPQINNAFMASTPRHALIAHCLDRIRNVHDFDGKFESTLRITGADALTESFLHLYKSNSTILALPTDYLYPLPCNHRDDLVDITKYLYPKTIAVHLWHTSWKGRGLHTKIFRSLKRHLIKPGILFFRKHFGAAPR